MVRCLRRWNGRIVSLQIDQKTYFGGEVIVEVIGHRQSNIPNKVTQESYTRTAERRYYYQTSSGKRIPIFHTGPNKVIEEDGRLVKLTNDTSII